MKLDRRVIRLLVAIAAAVFAWLVNLDTSQQPGSSPHSGASDVLRAIEQRASDRWVETDAVVTRILGDDNHGSRHQRILVDIAGRSVLIAHNIDLAARVPARKGDALRIRGEFEWNEKGGVIHWTHHDPQGRKAGGWIEHRGQRFQYHTPHLACEVRYQQNESGPDRVSATADAEFVALLQAGSGSERSSARFWPVASIVLCR